MLPLLRMFFLFLLFSSTTNPSYPADRSQSDSGGRGCFPSGWLPGIGCILSITFTSSAHHAPLPREDWFCGVVLGWGRTDATGYRKGNEHQTHKPKKKQPRMKHTSHWEGASSNLKHLSSNAGKLKWSPISGSPSPWDWDFRFFLFFPEFLFAFLSVSNVFV